MKLLLSLCLLAAPAALFADCGLAPSMRSHLWSAKPAAAVAEINPQPAARTPDWDRLSVTGLWHTKFISAGQVVDEGFDAWHADGLEILNDTPPPATGNVCLGVYSQTGARTFKLKHPSWIYDSANVNVIGIATIRETVILDRSGDSYSGTFTIDAVDLFGNPLGHIDGTISATRVKVD